MKDFEEWQKAITKSANRNAAGERRGSQLDTEMREGSHHVEGQWTAPVPRN